MVARRQFGVMISIFCLISLPLRKRMKVGEMETLVRTWSAAHELCEGHPDRKPLRDGGIGDVVDGMMENIWKAEGSWSRLVWRSGRRLKSRLSGEGL